MTASTGVAPAVPTTCKRLVANKTGNSFREAAVVKEVPVPQPAPGEVRKAACLHNSRLSRHCTRLLRAGTAEQRYSRAGAGRWYVCHKRDLKRD